MNATRVPAAWTSIPMLMYHDIEVRKRDRKYKHFYVLAHDFSWQMLTLKKWGYNPISFAQLCAALRGETSLPSKPVILTFDDGYRNVLTLAHPILERLSFPYTVFIVTGKVGGTNDWVVEEGYETSPLLNWDELTFLQSSGLADLQAHTVTHRRLSRLPDNVLRDELLHSKSDLEERFQHKIDTVCYPYGDYSPHVADVARSVGYSMGVTTEFGRVRREDDPLMLPRVSIHHIPPVSFDYGISSMNFSWKVRSRVDRRT